MAKDSKSHTTPLPRKDRTESGAAWSRSASEEFTRFEDLTKHVLSVPKSDLGKKRKDAQS